MWNKVPCPRSELELLYTLCGGQCFRWKKTGSEEWRGVFGHRVWTLSQDDENILYKVSSELPSDSSKDTAIMSGGNRLLSEKRKDRRGKTNKESIPVSETANKKIYQNEDTNKPSSKNGVSLNENISEEELLRKYFRLDVSLKDYYSRWSKNDPYFKEASEKFTGVRILSQDPVENVFSFICSSNNNIARISSMVEKLCVLYGNVIGETDGVVYHDFPPVEALTDPAVEKSLRDAGFGYRAKFIYQSACKIVEMGGSMWLKSLQNLPYGQAKEELMKLSGIGAKVADCICLMSLGHLEAIPVDTHIYQVAVQRYLPHLKGRKTVTDKIYNEIGDHFRSLYGSLAGWAHTILFCADLKMFQDSPLKQRSGANPPKRKRKQTEET